MAKILLVEDDALLRCSITDLLEADNHVVESTDDGSDASQLLSMNQYDLLIVDWGLPGKTGVALCEEIRKRSDHTPVLMLTARSAIEEKVTGLNAGADDYLAKPFDMRELQARTKALLRRSNRITEAVFKAGNLVIDMDNHKVLLKEAELELLPLEFSLLEFFVRNRNRVMTTEEILNGVWKSDSDATRGALRQCLVRLRKKLDDDHKNVIQSVYAVGYKFVVPD